MSLSDTVPRIDVPKMKTFSLFKQDVARFSDENLMRYRGARSADIASAFKRLSTIQVRSFTFDLKWDETEESAAPNSRLQRMPPSAFCDCPPERRADATRSHQSALLLRVHCGRLSRRHPHLLCARRAMGRAPCASGPQACSRGMRLLFQRHGLHLAFAHQPRSRTGPHRHPASALFLVVDGGYCGAVPEFLV